MNLSNIKLESCASVVCLILAFFFKIALLIALILQFRVVYMLHKDSHSTTLFNRFVIAWVINAIFCLGVAFVNPSVSVSMGFNTFYIGTIAILVSAPMLIICVYRFTKEVVAIANEWLFWGIFCLALIEVSMGMLWLLSYLWYWLSIMYGFRHLSESLIGMYAFSAFVITAVLIITILRTDELQGGESKSESNNDESMRPTASLQESEADETIQNK